MEGAAVALDGLKPHLATHQLNQIVRNGEAQSRATVVPGDRVVRLRKGLENPALLLRRNAYSGVLDPEMDLVRVLVPCRAHLNLAFGRELQCIAYQIGKDLPQSNGVT